MGIVVFAYEPPYAQKGLGQCLMNSGGHQNHLESFVKPQDPHPSLLRGAGDSVVSVISQVIQKHVQVPETLTR